jgi:tricorn protease
MRFFRSTHLLRGITAALLLASATAFADNPPAPTPSPAPAPIAPAAADAAPLWMRYSAISPDGKTIAFSYRGHLFTVPSAGGAAIPLTASPAHDFQPVWSPDGKEIAYASNAYGNLDVYIIPAAGGAAQRLTTYSTDEVPTGFAPDGRSVLFSGHRQDSRTNAQFPSARVMPELYRVSVEPGRAPVQILTTPALAARYNRAGDRIVYEDLKGYENLWRKHEKTSVTHDIWLYDVKTGTHTQLTTFVGEDRNPVWSTDEKAIFYLSEQSGSFNVWKLYVDSPQTPIQITNFHTNPVRFLSISDAGDLCFGYDGEIYTLTNGALEPKKVSIQLASATPSARSKSSI